MLKSFYQEEAASAKEALPLASQSAGLLDLHNPSLSVRSYLFKQVLWDLSGLARAGLSFYDKRLMFGNGGQQVCTVRKDGQAAAHLLDGKLLALRFGQLWILLHGLSEREWP